MKKELKFRSRLLTGILFLVFLFGTILLPTGVSAQTQIKNITYRAVTTGSDCFKVKQMVGFPQIYEFLINDNIVLRYRTMYNGLSAKERSQIILARAEKMEDTLKEGKIAVDFLNGCSVVTVEGELFITVTEADYKSNKSTPDGLARVWAETLRKARENWSSGDDQGDKDQSEVTSPSSPARKPSRSSSPKPPKITPPEEQPEDKSEVTPPPTEKPQDPPEVTPPQDSPEVTPPEEEKPQEPRDVDNGSTVTASAEELQMLTLVNAERTKNGLKPLIMKSELVKIARLKSQDMIEYNYFAHNSPTYGDPFTMMRYFGVKFGYAGENLAGNTSLENAHESLMNSSGHRANILNVNYTHMGIGIVEGGKYGKMFTQLFISE